MTDDELRAKLKHIAGLCLALAVDAGKHADETEALRQRVRELEAIIDSWPAKPVKRRKTGVKRNWTDEQREAQRQRMQAMHARHRAAKAAKENI